MKKKGLIWKILTPIFAVLLVASIVAVPVTDAFATVINIALGTTTQKVIADPDAEIYFWTNYESEQDLVEVEHQLCRDLESEGATLLVNREKTLPLARETKFSLFSQSSVDLIYGGTGSGHVSADNAITLKDALEAVFGEGAVNPTLWDFYKGSGHKRVNASTTGGHSGQYRLDEVPWSEYTDSVKNSFAEYGDAAVVVLARSGGEGADLPSGLESLTDHLTDGDYLRLCKEEIELLENLEDLKEQGVFKKIIVLLNSSNSIQLDFLDDYGIDAVMWIGDVGMTGILGVADILAGDVNPSGRLVDTFLKDNHSSPAMQNFGAYEYVNGFMYDVAGAQNNTQEGIEKCNESYVVYAEGIYVGYRYYETRYEDFVLNQGNAGDYRYDADVAFPFGYGLSYTTFEYSNFTLSENGDHFVVGVDVTNTGSVDGKHTVQVYIQSPYTQYDIENGVEKSAVELRGFDKKMITAGSTEHFELIIQKEDLVSYDANGAKTYILDAGDYYFTVGTDAHNAINNILAAKGADADRMYGSGDASLAAVWNNPTLDTTTYSVSTVTGNPITNLFDDADPTKYEGTQEMEFSFLTRSDWVGTWPATTNMWITEKMWEDGLTHEEEGRQAIVERMKAQYYSGITEVPAMGVSGSLSASDFVEADVNDPDWYKLISQATYDEMKNLIYNGFHLTQPVPSIGLPGTLDENGPQGFTLNLTGGASAMAYTSEDVMAATFNLELIEKMGSCIGEDFLHATDADADTVYAGIYGPGANIHRTPYSGRNFEYYSEDGWLSGKIAATEVVAIQERGVYVFVKHFALNDQEEGRYGISTWAQEQAIREIYLKGFEGAVEAGAMGVMSSFNRIGVVWAGAHYGLMTGILRDEWGMKGAAITDCSVFAKYMDYRMGLLAGQDLWDGYSMQMATLEGLQDDPVIVSVMQRATKNIAYSVTHSHAMNIGNATIVPVTPWWQMAIYGLVAVSAVMTLFCAVMLIRTGKKSKEPNCEK